VSASRPAIAASVCLLALATGCTLRLFRAGDDRFLQTAPEWRPGVTTALDVARELGPPDLVRWSDRHMTFIYRFQRRVRTSLALSFYLRLFQRERGRQEDSTLVVTFDADDRLLHHGTSEVPPADWSGDLGLW
jgi:hypothetical protein